MYFQLFAFMEQQAPKAGSSGERLQAWALESTVKSGGVQK